MIAQASELTMPLPDYRQNYQYSLDPIARRHRIAEQDKSRRRFRDRRLLVNEAH
jgi:hypothetical protein